MSRRAAITRWIGLLALCLGLLAGLTPAPAAAATPGNMIGWGSDDSGSLCLGSATIRKLVPTAAIGAAASDVVAVAAGGYYSLALKANGTIFACGYNRYYGQLGNGVGEDGSNHPTPQQVVGITGATAIAAGTDHNLAVAGGTVYSWGRNTYGALGQGSTDGNAHPTPAQVGGLSGVQSVAAGQLSSFAIKTDGTLWSWGNNSAGQLGLGTTGGSHTTPAQVFISPGVPLLAMSVAPGEQHTAVVSTDGKVYTFGTNSEGELGIGTAVPTFRNAPGQVTALGADNVAVASGYRHLLALKSGGTVWSWGQNSAGELGRAASAPDLTPAAIAGLTSVTALGSGQGHSLALLTDGTVRAWGQGGAGALGNNSQSNSSTPVQVSGLTNVVALSTGVYAQNSLAIAYTPPLPTIVSLSPPSLQFPNQPLNTTSAAQVVRLSVSGQQPLVVSAIAIIGAHPGDFAQTNDCAAAIPPTGNCTISVTFRPTATGTRSATLQITDNAANSPQQVPLGGTGLDVPPPYTLQITYAGAAAGTVDVSATGLTTAAPNRYLIPRDNVATLSAQASGSVFIGWKLDGVFMGWGNPVTLSMNTDHTMEATFVPIPAFGDVPGGQDYTYAVLQLAARDIIRGCDQTATPRLYCPADLTLRAQMAALIARASGWDAEDHGTTFPDRGPIDDNLWRNVGTVAFYNVARGYPDGTYNPLGEVLHAQTVSFITRAMITRGYWDLQPDSGAYPNVPLTSGHRQDLATFVHYAGALPDFPDTNAPFTAWDQPSARAWFARTLWQAINSYWGVDRVP